MRELLKKIGWNIREVGIRQVLQNELLLLLTFVILTSTKACQHTSLTNTLPGTQLPVRTSTQSLFNSILGSFLSPFLFVSYQFSFHFNVTFENIRTFLCVCPPSRSQDRFLYLRQLGVGPSMANMSRVFSEYQGGS